MLQDLSAQRGPAEARRKFAGRRDSGEQRQRKCGEGAQERGTLCAKEGECEEEEEEGAVELIKEREGGPKTAGPARFASRPATVRVADRHVSQRYTRKRESHTEAHMGSEAVSGIRSGAVNERASVNTK